MVDVSPTTENPSADPWEVGPWPFTDIYRLTLDQKESRIEVFLEDRDEFVVLEGRKPGERCTYKCEATNIEFGYNMRLGANENFYTRELRINRTNGAFHHIGTMIGGSLNNSMIQRGYCTVISTGQTSF